MIETLHVGGVRIAIRDAVGSRPHLVGTVASFASNGEPDLTLDVFWGTPFSLSGSVPPRFASGGLWNLFEIEGRLRFEFVSPALGAEPYRTVEIDSSWKHGVVTLRSDALNGEVSAIEYPLDEVLVTNLLARAGGVEIHACGLVHEGNGYLFVGHSGAGKSTTAELFRAQHEAAAVLSDDRIILRPESSGVTMWGTPWHGEAHLSMPASSSLSRIFVLRQAEENSAIRLRPASATAALLSRCFIPLWNRDAVETSASTVESIAQSVPVYELSFRRDAGAVEVALSC